MNYIMTTCTTSDNSMFRYIKEMIDYVTIVESKGEVPYESIVFRINDASVLKNLTEFREALPMQVVLPQIQVSYDDLTTVEELFEEKYGTKHFC